MKMRAYGLPHVFHEGSFRGKELRSREFCPRTAGFKSPKATNAAKEEEKMSDFGIRNFWLPAIGGAVAVAALVVAPVAGAVAGAIFLPNALAGAAAGLAAGLLAAPLPMGLMNIYDPAGQPRLKAFTSAWTSYFKSIGDMGRKIGNMVTGKGKDAKAAKAAAAPSSPAKESPPAGSLASASLKEGFDQKKSPGTGPVAPAPGSTPPGPAIG